MLKLFTLLVGIEQAGFPNFGILYLELIVCRVSTEASAAEPTSADEAELAATEPCSRQLAAEKRDLLTGLEPFVCRVSTEDIFLLISIL